MLIPQRTKTSENLVQHCNIDTWRWRHIWRHQNAVYRQRQTFNKSFSKAKTWQCKSVAERISEQKLESSLVKSLSEKLINSVLSVPDPKRNNAGTALKCKNVKKRGKTRATIKTLGVAQDRINSALTVCRSKPFPRCICYIYHHHLEHAPTGA